MSDEFPHSKEYDRYEDLHMGKYTSPDGRIWFEQPRFFGRLTYACENYLAIWDYHRHDGVKLTQKDGTVLGYFPTIKAAHESVFGVPKNEQSSDVDEITRLRADLAASEALAEDRLQTIAVMQQEKLAAEAREANFKRLLRDSRDWNWIDWEEEKGAEFKDGNIAAGCFTFLAKLDAEIDAALSEKGAR